MRSSWKEEVQLPKLVIRNYSRVLRGLDRDLIKTNWNKY